MTKDDLTNKNGTESAPAAQQTLVVQIPPKEPCEVGKTPSSLCSPSEEALSPDTYKEYHA